MSMSRSAKIILLLTIDIAFFFIELISGYIVGSLALVADSFHMLNDVMSLLVALYAIKLTAQSATDSRYTYGWHRAEILAALVNGVFLLALCFSISIEAIQRLFSTPEVSNPQLIVVVGSFGLASNIVGLLLFHDHGHSHDHSHNQNISKPVSDVAPSAEDIPGDVGLLQGNLTHTTSRPRSTSFSSLYGHPAATRVSLVQTANDMASTSPSRYRKDHQGSWDADRVLFEPDDDDVSGDVAGHATITTHERTPLLRQHHDTAIFPDQSQPVGQPGDHHAQHAGSMNMRALLLHVLGDALGNVGVIATGLVIWLTEWSFKDYFDPIISLFISAVILSSALPLVRSASFILLQGVPATISVEDVRTSILDVEGVLSLHELHIWQLSETKIVASVHVTASRNHDFMHVASNIRKVLHHQGIHCSTIQPEYHHPRNAEQASKTSGCSPCLITCPPDRGCDPSDSICSRV